MSLCVVIGSAPGITASSDVTRRLTSLTFSNVDPGGFEIASIGLAGNLAAGIRPNAEVRIMLGGEVAWHGRVNAIGEDDAEDAATYTVDCVGYGAVLSDSANFRMVFVDRDLSRWTAPSSKRQLTLVTAPWGNCDNGPEVLHDVATGLPALRTGFSDAWTQAASGVESYYDAGVGNLVGSVAYDWAKLSTVDNTNVNWSWKVGVSTDDVLTTATQTGNLSAAGPSLGQVYTAPTPSRYAFLQLLFSGAGGSAGTIFGINWSNLAVHGNHGITKRGSAPQGYYPGDIASYVVSQAAPSWPQIIGTDSLTYVCYHSVYRDPGPHETVVDDMANLLGWHWGVWEPVTVDSGTRQPIFYFTPRPASPTFTLRRRTLTQLSAPKLQLDQLYSSVVVKYTDASGTAGSVTVAVANPFLAEAGASRVLMADGGLMGGGVTEATAYGNMLLALAQAAARGSGSAITPAVVEVPDGTYKPAALIKAGRDRVRIVDLPDSGPFDVADSRRFDTFRVKRVESTLQSDGTLQTRIEFDGGADLMEVLTARLAIASTLASV